MDKILKRSIETSKSSDEEKSRKKYSRVEFSRDDVVSDPGLRKSIEEFDVSIRDQIRREYLIRGPCQPIDYSYPRRQFGKDYRSFQYAWFNKYPWLEYSLSKDAAFCFWCYLFKSSRRGCRVGDGAFTKSGINNWKKALEIFKTHAGGVASAHNDARIQVQAFQNHKQSVAHLLEEQGHEMEMDRPAMEIVHRTCLTVVLDVTRFLLKQGLPFYRHDESLCSSNKGNFLELIEWYTQRNEEVAKTTNENVTGNNEITSSEVQKELTNACAAEVTNAILNDLGDNIFSLIVDEFQDISIKEQMGIVLRYVNKRGHVIERFLAIVHVPDTSTISLKNAIDVLFAKYKLSLSKLRGQGYGASNRGEYNELKALILKEYSSARYVHCFAHQLQLVVVAVCKSNRIVSNFFQYLTMIVNVTGASCKIKDKLRQLEHGRLVECLERGDIDSGKRKNQETRLKPLEDTCWGSHYITIVHLMCMWTSILQELENVYDDGTNDDNSGIATSLIDKMESYEFVFVMHLAKCLLGITNELSFALQQKDQNIVLVVSLIKTMKARLQEFKEEGWANLLDEVNTFCCNYMIPVPNMEENMRIRGRSRRNGQMISNFHHYRGEIFCEVVDMMVQEMNNRFSEASTELLTCIACLDPKDSFSQFDIGKLLRFAKLYPEDFSLTDRVILEEQLKTYISHVRGDVEFSVIEDLGGLAKKMVQTGKNVVFSLVYRLIELALVLPVANASVERVFSAMKTMKTDLHNRMRDECLNDNMIPYIENEVFAMIEKEQILQRFEQMQTHRMSCTSSSSVNK